MFTLKKITNFILDLLFPKECLSCQKQGEWLCNECLEKISLKQDFECLVCGQTTFQGLTHKRCLKNSKINGLVVALEWREELTKDLIHKYKFDSLKDLAKPLARLLIKKIDSCPTFKKWLKESTPLVIPIPLHKKRVLERGFNQAELLALELAHHYHLEPATTSLIRSKPTKPQTKLKSDKRLWNIKDAFEVVNTSRVRNKNIILIDDVTTTGATLQEAAKKLKKARVKTIWALVLARG